MKKLNQSQRRTLECLKRSIAKGIIPSIREICDETGATSTSTVHGHLKTLEILGFIHRPTGLNRSLVLRGMENVNQIPVLETATNSSPDLDLEQIKKYIPFTIEQADGVFAFQVKDSSMNNIGIFENDYIIARNATSASHGDTVVALVDGEITVKTFNLENSIATFTSQNSEYDTIVPNEYTIFGKLIALSRHY